MTKRLLRPDEAAMLLRVSRWTIYRWLSEGKLRGTRLGKGSIRIFKDSIDDYIKSNDFAILSQDEQAGQQSVDWPLRKKK